MSHRHLPSWLKPAPDSVVADNLKLGKWPWLDAVHLLWSVWVFVTPVFSGGFTLRWTLITLWSYPLFLLLYALTLLASRRTAPLFALGMIVLTFALLPVYPSGISYFIFGCVMLRTGCSRSTTRYLLELVALNIVFMAQAMWIGYPWQSIASVPVLSIIIGLIVNVERASSEKDAALRLSHEEVRRLAATAERERIGRDLHDLLGHTLSLITLKLELSRKLLERDPARSQGELAEAEQIARDALAQVRSAVTGFRAADMAAELASAHLLLESSRVHLRHAPPPPMPGWDRMRAGDGAARGGDQHRPPRAGRRGDDRAAHRGRCGAAGSGRRRPRRRVGQWQRPGRHARTGGGAGRYPAHRFATWRRHAPERAGTAGAG